MLHAQGAVMAASSAGEADQVVVRLMWFSMRLVLRLSGGIVLMSAFSSCNWLFWYSTLLSLDVDSRLTGLVSTVWDVKSVRETLRRG